MNGDVQYNIGELKAKLSDIQKRLDSIEQKLDLLSDTRPRLDTIEKVVFGLVSMVLLTVGYSIIKIVVNGGRLL